MGMKTLDVNASLGEKRERKLSLKLRLKFSETGNHI